jgi:hypothetical protein
MNLALPTPFTQWNDAGQYFLIAGGNFEGDMSGWTLTGNAGVTSGNEPYQVGSPTDSNSLALGQGDTATTPSICVTALSPDIRFFALETGQDKPNLEVDINYVDAKGKPQTKKIANIPGTDSWVLTPAINFLKPIDPLLKASGQTNVSFTFKPMGPGAAFQIDDTYVDPIKSQ